MPAPWLGLWSIPRSPSSSSQIAGIGFEPPKLSHFRELLVGSYRLVYLVQRQRVLIVGVLHGHRSPERALKGRG